MIVASIDLGTNTFDLLILNVSANSRSVLHRSKEWVGLGLNFYPENNISEESLHKAMRCIDEFISIANHYKVQILTCAGTSALREAKNANELLDRIENLYNLKVEIISGELEAALVFKGMSSFLDIPEGIIMDVGGGSTEFTFFKDKLHIGCSSTKLGVTRLLALCPEHNRLSNVQINELKMHFLHECKSLITKQKYLIGASGVFETLAQEIIGNQLISSRLVQLPVKQLNDLLNMLICSSRYEREGMHWVPEYRRKYIHLAALQIQWVIKAFQIEAVFVTTSGLGEGLISKAIESSEM